MRDLVTVDSKSFKVRAALTAIILVTLLLGWLGVRWQLGSMLAALTSPGSPDAASIADVALDFAPSDPVASWLRGSVDAATPDAKMYENAVRLSPFDYRWRIELARVYDQTDRSELAEVEFKEAVVLAPTYAYPHWQLGNFYLRHGRVDDAFAELKLAAVNNHTYREQVFSLAWDYFDKDPAKVEQLAPDSPDAKAALALFFAARGKAADALRVWNTLSEDQKAANPQFAKLMAMGLYSQRSFPQSLEFFRQLGIDLDAQAGAVTNPGFERTILPVEESPFGWQMIRNDSKIDITADSTTKHGGSRSLRVAFRNYAKADLANIFQIVAVEPNKSYRLTFWVRTENLKTSGTPLLLVMNANDDRPLGASKPFSTGSTEWQQYIIDIKTPESCNGIRLQTSRVPCGEQCPIIGTFWYDDFELTAQ